MAYLDVAAFATLTTMPPEFVDALEGAAPGFLAAQLEAQSRWVDARLSKRYAVPFASPYPEVVRGWVARLVTVRAYLKRGVDPSDLQFEAIKEDAERAMDEVKEAADSMAGLYDLPLIEGSSSSGVVRGGPYGYSEASPYVWVDVQADAGRAEDRTRGGSYG